MIRVLVTAFVLCWASAGAVISVAVGAAELRVLDWDDLMPSEASIGDPFAGLSEEQTTDVKYVAMIRDYQDKLGDKIDGNLVVKVQKLEKKLAAQGIDVEAAIQKVIEAVKRAEAVVPVLDGQLVKLPGFIVPVEHEGTKVKEFLLVPYYGACIHTPPPPPNQIVYVRMDKAHDAPDLYDPVWVTGTISTQTQSQSLFISDGTTDVTTGYAMTASLIMPYRE
jgi:hypothetical protein